MQSLEEGDISERARQRAAELATCPSKSIPAGEIERFIVDQIRAIGQDPTLVRDTVAQTRSLGQSERLGLESELRGVRRDLAHWDAEVRELLSQVEPGNRETSATKRLADLQERTRARITQIMNLRMLAPDIQEAILFLPRVESGHDPLHLRQLQPIALVPDWRKQRRKWRDITED